eukprot:1567546-Prorocentrum_lima.AAC.1
MERKAKNGSESEGRVGRRWCAGGRDQREESWERTERTQARRPGGGRCSYHLARETTGRRPTTEGR